MKNKLAGWDKSGKIYTPPKEMDEKKMQEYFKKNPTAPAPKLNPAPKVKPVPKVKPIPSPKRPQSPLRPKSPFDMRNRYFA